MHPDELISHLSELIKENQAEYDRLMEEDKKTEEDEKAEEDKKKKEDKEPEEQKKTEEKKKTEEEEKKPELPLLKIKLERLKEFKVELNDHFPGGNWFGYLDLLDSKGKEIFNRFIRSLNQEYKASDVKRNAMIAILASAFLVTLSLVVYGFCMISEIKPDNAQEADTSSFDIEYLQINESDSTRINEPNAKGISGKMIHSDFSLRAKPKAVNSISRDKLWAGVFLISVGVFVFVISNVAFATYFARKRGL